MTLAEEFIAGTADRATATRGFSVWQSATQGMVLIEVWSRTRDGKIRLAFPDESIAILNPDGSEEAGSIHA